MREVRSQLRERERERERGVGRRGAVTHAQDMNRFSGPDRKRQRQGDYAKNGGFSSSSMDGLKPHPSVNGQAFLADAGGTVKPCLKFFSTCGCPYGEGCHFSHYVQGGFCALTMSGVGVTGSRRVPGVLGLASLAFPSPSSADGGANLGGYKTRLCNRYGTKEGCRFGEKCHFAHGEKELRKPNGISFGNQEAGRSTFSFPRDPAFTGGLNGAYPSQDTALTHQGAVVTFHREPTPPGIAAAASFGASSTAKISIDANMAGAIIGRGGMHAKQICRMTGAKISICEHENDPNLRNVEMEGTFDQIKSASQMVQELLMNKDPLPPKPAGFGSHNYKTKMCENFAKGNCTFGECCHFAHGDAELRFLHA